ncbi:hypothetical protein AKO1_010839 [Acrasis kona]|uniref:Uncharacterized protein n=1 Tax=Acrasis kona TaxID=1008807 RepID=A0AAW2YJZ7_9EUKA
MSDDAIKVAVRVRPFNDREKGLNAKMIIEMQGNETSITNPENNEVKRFTFDYSYYSHDSTSAQFADQTRVYNDLGKKVLENAWEGYNCCLFAYGQTGSGKSYSMVGYGEDTGIVPRSCIEIFSRISESQTDSLSFKVESSMIEIYNEQVRDLFNPSSNIPGGLKVRENPSTGPYVEDLCVMKVTNYNDISSLMDKGTKARTVASTNMNNNSSRAHTIFQIILTQTIVDKNKGTASDKVSKISLVDLAGSEKAKDTGATGDRLKEGSAINKSLSALGNVIAALVKRGNAVAANKGKKLPAGKEIFIPYRDSVLTWLIKESLGGNSRTIMIAALSPADTNYQETLSTLQYANRAKQIKNKAVVNEDPNERIIKELKAEVEALRRQLGSGGGPSHIDDPAKSEEMEKLKEQLMESQRIISSLQMSEEEKSERNRRIAVDRDEVLRVAGVNQIQDGDTTPYLTNLHFDPVLNETLVFHLRKGNTVVGRRTKDGPSPDIPLGGVKIQNPHCTFINEDSEIYVTPSSSEAAVFVNGERVNTDKFQVNHGSRIIFGSNHVFKFCDPSTAGSLTNRSEDGGPQDYYSAQRELAEKQGITDIIEDKKTDDEMNERMKALQEQIEKEKLEKQSALDQQKKRLLNAKKKMEQEYLRKEKELMESADARKEGELSQLKSQLEAKQREAEQAIKAQQDEIEKQRLVLEQEARKQRELAEKFQAKRKSDMQDKSQLEEKLVKLIPMITEMNAMAKEMNRPVTFSVKLISILNDDVINEQTRTDIGVKVIDEELHRNYLWNYEKFKNRYYILQEMYQKYLYDQEASNAVVIDRESDPLWDPDEEQSRMVGIGVLYMKPLCHHVDMNEIWIPLISDTGNTNCGELLVSIAPFDFSSKQVISDQYVADSNLLIGETICFQIGVKSARGLPSDKCLDAHVRFKMPSTLNVTCDSDFVKTPTCEKRTMCPEFSYVHLFHIKSISKQDVDCLHSCAIKFEVFAKPSDMVRPITSGSRPMSSAGGAGNVTQKQENVMFVSNGNGDGANSYEDLLREGEMMVNQMASDNQSMRTKLQQLLNTTNDSQLKMSVLESEKEKLQREIEALQKKLRDTENKISELPPTPKEGDSEGHIRRATLQIQGLSKMLQEEKEGSDRRVEMIEKENSKRLRDAEKRFLEKQEEARQAVIRMNELESMMERDRANGIIMNINRLSTMENKPVVKVDGMNVNVKTQTCLVM